MPKSGLLFKIFKRWGSKMLSHRFLFAKRKTPLERTFIVLRGLCKPDSRLRAKAPPDGFCFHTQRKHEFLL